MYTSKMSNKYESQERNAKYYQTDELWVYRISVLAFWFIILTFLAWVILFAANPGFVSRGDNGSEIDYWKLLAWSIFFALIVILIIIIIWIIVARVRANR